MAVKESNQERFLNSIAKKLGRERRRFHEVSTPKYENHPQEMAYKKLEDLDYCELFCKMLVDQNGKPVVLRSLQELHEQLKQTVKEQHVRKVMVWDDNRLKQLGLERLCEKNHVQCDIWKGDNFYRELTMKAEQAQMGITWGDLALAETGTIVLQNGKGKGRVVSLLPNMHLVMISKKQIKGRFSDAVKQMKQLKEEGKVPACTNFISGPSYSADIATTFVRGVHGPKDFHVYILDFEIEKRKEE